MTDELEVDNLLEAAFEQVQLNIFYSFRIILFDLIYIKALISEVFRVLRVAH